MHFPHKEKPQSWGQITKQYLKIASIVVATGSACAAIGLGVKTIYNWYSDRDRITRLENVTVKLQADQTEHDKSLNLKIDKVAGDTNYIKGKIDLLIRMKQLDNALDPTDARISRSKND